MNERSGDKRPAGRTRSTPVLTQSGVGAEGAGILSEVPGPAGVLLWGALRDVRLWSDASGEERDEAFESGGSDYRLSEIDQISVEEEIGTPLRYLAGLAERPAGGNMRQILSALRRIASWAGEHGAPETQLAFTQAAALLRPRDPQLALEVGRLARNLGYPSQAESWFRRSIALARRANDWASYAWSYNGLGVLYLRSGNIPAARILFDRALRVANRRRLQDVRGAVHHHLFHLTTEAGQLRDAYEHIRAAVEAYGPENPALPGLLSDVGRFWLHIGAASRALPLFEAASARINDKNVRAMVLANVARAAATIGDRMRYESARRHSVDLIARAPGRSRVAETWASLAYADLAAEAWGRAEAAASKALQIAVLTREAEVRMVSEEQLLAARERRVLTSIAFDPESPSAERQSERLASDLLAVMRTGATSGT